MILRLYVKFHYQYTVRIPPDVPLSLQWQSLTHILNVLHIMNAVMNACILRRLSGMEVCLKIVKRSMLKDC
jgi:hypothetical protein